MPDFAAPVERLIDELKHLPGIGQKTAQRLAFFLLRAAPEDALALADAIRDAKEKIHECSVCHNITDADPCLYCTGATRSRATICVVEEAHNIMATNPTAEGEATAVYMSKLLKPLGVRVTRIGVGIPVGADLEYADEVTMLKAMEGRRDL